MVDQKIKTFTLQLGMIKRKIGETLSVYQTTSTQNTMKTEFMRILMGKQFISRREDITPWVDMMFLNLLDKKTVHGLSLRILATQSIRQMMTFSLRLLPMVVMLI